jgi:hypothetical protein
MKCPLCQNTFQAPALPPPVAPSPPPPAPGPYAAEPPAAPPPEAPRRKKEKEREKERDKEAAPPPPPVPTSDYAHTRSIWVSPRVVPWVAPAALFVTFLLTFFSWGYAGTSLDHIAWGWGWSPEWNALTLLYTLVLLMALLASAAITALRLVPNFTVPAGLEQVWPWRAALVALFALLGLFFLAMQLFVGFVPKDLDLVPMLHTTGFVWLALLFQVIATVAALLDFWLEVRGPGRPMPRIDISW